MEGRVTMSTDDRTAPPPPPSGWRTEGVPATSGQPPTPPFYKRRRFWLMVVVLLAVNWIISASLTDELHRLHVPYTVFREQVEADNVASVTSRGDTIQGDFGETHRSPIPTTVRGGRPPTSPPSAPAFADDQLLQMLIRSGAEVNAEPVDKPTPVWQTVLLGFGPTLLFVGIFVLLMRGTSRGPGAGHRGAHAQR